MSKVYAVKVGVRPGIYYTWEECKAQVFHYPKAQYKSFTNDQDAFAYMNGTYVDTKKLNAEQVEIEEIKDINSINVFTDGSFKDGRASFGLILKSKAKEWSFFGVVDATGYKVSNVTGELTGAMVGIQAALNLGFNKIHIYADYEGVIKWAEGIWKANTKQSSKYYEFIRYVRQEQLAELKFTHVKGHTHVMENEHADVLAKRAFITYGSEIGFDAVINMKLDLTKLQRG